MHVGLGGGNELHHLGNFTPRKLIQYAQTKEVRRQGKKIIVL